MKNIILVEDHQLFRESIQIVLAQDPDIVIKGTYSAGEEFMNEMDSYDPSIILMDVDLPGISGLDLAKIVEEKGKHRIVFLTMHVEAYYIGEMIRVGALGVLNKNVSIDELLLCIDSVHKGENYISKELHNDLFSIVKYKGVSAKGRITELSPEEQAMLYHLSKGLSNKELSEVMHRSNKTIESWKNKLFKKFDVGNSVSLIVKAIRLGVI